MAERLITVDDMTGKETLTGRKYVITMAPVVEKGSLESTTATFDLDQDSAIALWRWIAESDSRDMAAIMRKVPSRLANTGNGSQEVIRAWAKANGFPNIAERGALPRDVKDAYEKAHQQQ